VEIVFKKGNYGIISHQYGIAVAKIPV